ncbi:MAG: conjugal transfer protein TraK [gamma proteobacterium symbiont of Clathrolucina costata]
MRKLVGLLLTLTVCSTAVAESPVPLIPIVPVAKAKANLPEPPQKKTVVAAKEQSAEMLPATIQDKSQIVMQPGVNEIIQVAVNHLNRIVTPYAEPKITTSSPVTTEIRDNVIYIGTTLESPVTLFITEKGSEERALSLTLIPRKIPPREIFLQLKQDGSLVRYTKEAEKWETSQPYIVTIEELFRTLALGELPAGYSFEESPKSELPACRQAGLNFDFQSGQTVIGHHMIVHVGVAENASPHPVEFLEPSCGDWDIAAVSAFPRNVLNPGDRTEIYVAQKRNYKKEIKVKRPSLLLGGK